MYVPGLYKISVVVRILTADVTYHASSPVPGRKSMPRGAFEDINRCFHFADDWDEPDDANWVDILILRR